MLFIINLNSFSNFIEIVIINQRWGKMSYLNIYYKRVKLKPKMKQLVSNKFWGF